MPFGGAGCWLTPRFRRRRGAGARSPATRSPRLRVLLLGATGAAGRRTAGELLRQREVEKLWLCGRKASEVERAVHTFGGPSDRVGGRTFDLSGDASHLAAYRDVDIVVSCAGPQYETEFPAAKAATEAGVSYVSLCDEHAALRQVQDLDGPAREAGITIVSGCGISPGITNMLIAHGAADLDTVEAIDIALARSSAESVGDATARHFLYELSYEAPVIRDRQNGIERSGTSPKLVYFPEPVGWVETYRCGHPETVTLPARYPGLDSLQFRLGLAEKITMDTARAFTATPFARSERARHLFVSLTKPARPLLDRLPPRGPSWTAARVDVRGTKGGNQTTTSLAVVDKLANFASVPLTLAALRLGAGDVSGLGVLSAEEAFDVSGFLKALTKRGIGVAVLEPSPV